MSSDVDSFPAGASSPKGRPAERSAEETPQTEVTPADAAASWPPLPAAGPGTSSSSGDGLNVSLTQVSPDPFLGEYVAPPNGPIASAPETLAAGDPKGADDDEIDDEDLPDHGINWPMALLASYASAVTLGLFWVLWSHRVARESPGVEPDPFRPAGAVLESGRRAGQSRKFVPPAPLPADRLVELGQTIRLGMLEVTPLEISSGTVILNREIRQHEARPGGDDALMLKLRLKNLSSDSILVPLDEAFLRPRAQGVRDSFVEAGQARQIEMFPLAVVSEWSIDGQEFRELNPGESYETLVVSAPGAVGRLDPTRAMTWRIRLRVEVNQTQALGIQFRAQDVRKMPRRVVPETRERPALDSDATKSDGRVQTP
jgi:hypothetical protein